MTSMEQPSATFRDAFECNLVVCMYGDYHNFLLMYWIMITFLHRTSALLMMMVDDNPSTLTGLRYSGKNGALNTLFSDSGLNIGCFLISQE
jgi:hypothetical protein